jgi:hypothetical protein
LYGFPSEVWSVQVNGIVAKPEHKLSDSTFTSGLKGKNTAFVSTTTKKIGVWEGNLNDLNIIQQTEIDISKLYVQFSVSLKNSGTTTLKDLYYLRETDIDHAEETTFSGTGVFPTHLKIENQIPNDRQLVSVSATSNLSKSYISLTTKDCRAKAYFMKTGLSTNSFLDSIYNQNTILDTLKYATGDSAFNDAGMGLVFKLDSLRPGETKIISYAYVLQLSEVDSLLSGAFAPKWTTSTGLEKRNNDTVFVCEDDILGINIVASGSNNWVWDPSPYLGSTIGATNLVFPKGINKFRAIRNNLTACGSIDTISLVVNALPKPSPVLSRVGTILSTTVKFITYQWYKNGVPIFGSIKDTLGLASNGIYKVLVKDANGCAGFSDSLVVNDIASSINEFRDLLSSHVAIFPNPTKGIITIDAPFEFEVALTDLSGRVLKQFSKNASIDLSDYTSGLYLIEFRDLDGRFIGVKKLMKE